MKKIISTLLAFVLFVSCLQIPAQAAWQKKEDNWYYTDANGKPVTGWYKDGGVWYYFNSQGVMQTGWLKEGNTWYYLSGSGAMATGWFKDGGTWYYFDGKGAMQTGWLKQGNIWYYLSGSGAMATGWQKISGVWYYFNGNGTMQTGWLLSGGIWHYMNASGAMQTGWVSVGEDKYYFYSSGAMAANTSVDGVILGQNGKAVQNDMVQHYIDYCGQWSSTTQFHFMSLFIEGGILYMDYSCVSGNANRIATVLSSIILSDIENEKATFYYSDDGWGNSGTLVLDFSEPDQISCTATTTYKDPGAIWSIVPGSYVFVQ